MLIKIHTILYLSICLSLFHMTASILSIQQIEIYQSPVKLKEPFVISLGPLEYAENIIVVIRTHQGIVGFGECSPFMTIHGESMETGFVVGQYLAKILIGKNPLDIELCAKEMDRIIYANSSIKSAFDIALYDIAAQHAGLPLYAFLGGNNKKKIITDYTISIGSVDKMRADAQKIIENGFQVIKVKLGGESSLDIARMKAIRAQVGNVVALRIDANQGWNVESALEVLNAIAPLGIQHCEEPIPRWDFMSLPDLKKKSPISIMADESCCDHHDAKRLIDLHACDGFNVKLSKSAGIFKALKIIKLAEEADIKIQIGGFLESRLGFTASAHLAMVSDHIIHYDFDTPLMFVEDPVEGGISYGSKGEVYIPETVGLGASVPETYLKKMIKVIVK